MQPKVLVPGLGDNPPKAVLYYGQDNKIVLKALDETVHCVVTSPPYWGLRDYGTARWEGGDINCDHVVESQSAEKKRLRSTLGPNKDGLNSGIAYFKGVGEVYRGVCQKCGAKRTDQQLGLEDTPETYVSNLVSIFREVHRVLHPTGTLWLNLGDTYFAGGSTMAESNNPRKYEGESTLHSRYTEGTCSRPIRSRKHTTLKPKDMVGIPWRTALALQEDGWYLKHYYVWSKLNHLPSPVTDRLTAGYESIFLFTKAPDIEVNVPEGTFWRLPTHPYSGAHFAVFPQELIEPMILAGTSDKGCCPTCGKPWTRVVEKGLSDYARLKRESDMSWQEMCEVARGKGKGVKSHRQHIGGTRNEKGNTLTYQAASTTFLGWDPSCSCGQKEVKPCIVLDPFSGSGTTGEVALQHGRSYIGLDLNAAYLPLATRRLLGEPESRTHTEVEGGSVLDLFGGW